MRQTLFDAARFQPSIFNLQSKSLNAKWNSVYRKQFLREKDYEKPQIENLKNKINEVWQDFLHQDLPQILDEITAFLH